MMNLNSRQTLESYQQGFAHEYRALTQKVDL
jgi:hypothetical protein